MPGQFLNRVAAITQPAGDRADGRLAGDDAFQSRSIVEIRIQSSSFPIKLCRFDGAGAWGKAEGVPQQCDVAQLGQAALCPGRPHRQRHPMSLSSPAPPFIATKITSIAGFVVGIAEQVI